MARATNKRLTIFTEEMRCALYDIPEFDEALRDVIMDLQTQNSVLNLQLTALQKELIDASQQNKTLAHDKWILGQEKRSCLVS